MFPGYWAGQYRGFGGAQLPPQGVFEVVFRNGTSFHLVYEQALAICPRLDNDIAPGRIIDVGAIADEMTQDYPIVNAATQTEDSSQIYRSLRRLFQALRDSGGNRDILHSLLIHNVFPSELDTMSGLGWRKLDGLRAGRRMFVVCANFAKRTESAFISSGLAEALIHHQHTILTREHPSYFAIWGMALMDIQPFLSRRETEGCLRALALRYDDIRSSGMYGYVDRRLSILVQMLEQLLKDTLGTSMRSRYLDDDCWSRGRNRFRSPNIYPRCYNRPQTTPPFARLPRPWQGMDMLTYPSTPSALMLPMSIPPLMPLSYKQDPCRLQASEYTNALGEMADATAILAGTQMQIQEEITDVKQDVQAIGGQVEEMGMEVQEMGDTVREILARVV